MKEYAPIPIIAYNSPQVFCAWQKEPVRPGPAVMPSVMLEVFPMMIDNIRVIIEQGPFSAEDAQYYIERIKATTKFTLKKVTFTRSDTYLDIRYAFAEIPFERIRRVALAAPPEKRAVNN